MSDPDVVQMGELMAREQCPEDIKEADNSTDIQHTKATICPNCGGNPIIKECRRCENEIDHLWNDMWELCDECGYRYCVEKEIEKRKNT